MRYKFRAWDKNAKKWYDRVQVGNDSNDANYVCHSVYDEERGWLDFDEHCGTVVQWTGLQDRAGVDIYEGDILSNGSHIDWIVIFKEASFQVEHVGQITQDSWELKKWMGESREVIGNRFENPELLKGE